MRWTINEEILAKNGLTIQEYLFLLFNAKGGDVHECVQSLIDKKWGNEDLFDDTKIVMSNNVKDKVFEILVDSDKLVENREDEFNSLANKLRELFPEGRKPGTTYSWRGSTLEVSRKLKNLVVKHGCQFTEEEAIAATKAYIESFNGDYKFMKLLKYFILKTPRNNDGDVEVQSDLMTFIENKHMGQRENGNWAVDLA